MANASALISIILEWLSWVLLFFTWAILTRSALRIYRRKKSVTFRHDRRIYFLSMTIGILVYILTLLFIADPLIYSLITAEKINLESSTGIFWSMALVLFFILPFVVSGIIARIAGKTRKEV